MIELNSEKKTIFLVDNTLINLAMSKNVLSDAYCLFPLDSAESMFELLNLIIPDLIILDILIPTMGGYEAIAQLKAVSHTAKIPVILLTSEINDENELKGISLGAIDCIGKPLSPTLLHECVEFHLNEVFQKRKLNERNYRLSKLVAEKIEENDKLHNSIRKYLDPKLADEFFKYGAPDYDTVGKKKHIAVLFADVRGFTAMAELLKDTPELVVETLNVVLEVTTKAVFDNGGSVDKFVGDSTMALFNGFVPQEEYIYSAVKAAWEMVEMSKAIMPTIEARIGTTLAYGIGIHCGEAIVGNVGPAHRKDYTAIGDTVNIASRLESNAGRSEILISRNVYDALEGRIIAESVGEMLLKGKKEGIEVYVLQGFC